MLVIVVTVLNLVSTQRVITLLLLAYPCPNIRVPIHPKPLATSQFARLYRTVQVP